MNDKLVFAKPDTKCAAEAPDAALLIIGNEILSGRTQDKHLPHLANWLNCRGIQLKICLIVPDEIAAIADAVNTLKPPYCTYLFTTGGIGPTHDDVTIDAIAHALGKPVVLNEDAKIVLQDYYGDKLTPARLRMGRAPDGAQLVCNPASGAPGFHLDNIFILAGVPDAMRAMLESLDPLIEKSAPIVSHCVGAWIKESQIATMLAGLEKSFVSVQIGSYPLMRDTRPGVNLVLRGTDSTTLVSCKEELIKLLSSQGIEPVDGGL